MTGLDENPRGYLVDLDLSVLHGCAFDQIHRLLDGTVNEHDGLSRERLGPFDHVLADLFRLNGNQGLDGVSALAQFEESHLCTLGARVVDASTEEDVLALISCRKGVDVGELSLCCV